MMTPPPCNKPPLPDDRRTSDVCQEFPLSSRVGSRVAASFKRKQSDDESEIVLGGREAAYLLGSKSAKHVVFEADRGRPTDTTGARARHYKF